MGLSKPIIIASESVDVSNLATKSDLDSIKNTVKPDFVNVAKLKTLYVSEKSANSTCTLTGKLKIHSVYVYNNHSSTNGTLTITVDGTAVEGTPTLAYASGYAVVMNTNKSYQGVINVYKNGSEYSSPSKIATFECEESFVVKLSTKYTVVIIYEEVE